MSEHEAPLLGSSSIQLRLAASHGDLGLFERGKSEAVQLPWTPMSAGNEDNLVRLVTSTSPDVSPEELLAAATLTSQQLRLGILQDHFADAMSAFDRLTSCFQTISTRQDIDKLDPTSSSGYVHETVKRMWIASLVRLLSASLRQGDLQEGLDTVTLAVEKLGSRYVGQQAISRLFQAACSPRFYPQSQVSLSRQRQAAPNIEWTSLERVLSILTVWAQDVHANDKSLIKAAVDEDMTSKQRLRSVLSKNSSSRVLARATGICLVSTSFAQHSAVLGDGRTHIATVDPVDALYTVLTTMSTLQANFKYTNWWEEVERRVAEQMDLLQISREESYRWQENCYTMARMCARFEEERLANSQSASH